MLDTTVLFAGTVWPRWSYEMLRHALRGDFQLVLSPLVIEQARQHLAAAFPRQLEAFETWLELTPFELADDPTPAQLLENESLMRDRKDVPIAISAIHAQVYCLVSEDKDFTAEDETTAKVRQRLKVMRPVIFLREVLGWSKADLEKVRVRNWSQEETAE
jgi:predicted nucleic acid-binding protein